jgi:uncharacterized protein YaaN involved in tellurite resistance
MAQKTQVEAEKEINLDNFSLDVPTPAGVLEPSKIEQTLGEKDSEGNVKSYSKLEQSIISNLDGQVDNIMSKIMTTPMFSEEMKKLTTTINKMGESEISKTSNMSSRILQRPLRAMRQNGAEGDSIAKALKGLRAKVESLDPSRRNKLISKEKLFGFRIPFGVGKKVDSYMQEFKSSEDQLNSIVQSLLQGKDELIEDNAHIDVEREQMYDLMQRLEQYAYILKKLDKKISDQIPDIEAEDKVKASDIKQEILFPIRQKNMDLFQHLAVCMQGYIALQVIKKNNTELMRGVDRATKTTIAALRTAVIVSEALGTQKLVLNQVNAVNDTTNKLIAQNAELLKTQGVDIQKQATESAVNTETLEKAFQQIFQAMDAIDTYREQALPSMEKTIASLDKSVSAAKSYLVNQREKRLADFKQDLNQSIDDNSQDASEDKKVVKLKI